MRRRGAGQFSAPGTRNAYSGVLGCLTVFANDKAVLSRSLERQWNPYTLEMGRLMPDVRELNDRNNFNTDPAVWNRCVGETLTVRACGVSLLGRVVQLARDAPTLLILQE